MWEGVDWRRVGENRRISSDFHHSIRQIGEESVQLSTCRDVGVYHEAVELLHALLVVDGGDDHAAGIDAHHLPGGKVGDGNEGLAHQFLRLVGIVDTTEDDPVGAGAVGFGQV